MDKETLSNYGWIVICVLVLAVMLALATPFGSYVSDAVKSTTQGLFDTNKNALNSTGLIEVEDNRFDDSTVIEFTIQGIGTYHCESGMTWGEWISSYGMSSSSNGIVGVGLDNTHIYADTEEYRNTNGPYQNNINDGNKDVEHSHQIEAITYIVTGPSI